MDSRKIIGTRINEVLAIRGVRQKDLAKHLGVTDNTISYYCSGARTPSILQITEIAKFLNVSTDYLLGMTNTMTQKQTIQSMVQQLGLPEHIVELLVTWNNLKHISNKNIDDLTAMEKEILNLVDDVFPMQKNRYFWAQENFQTFITYLLSAFEVNHDRTDRTSEMLYNFSQSRGALVNDGSLNPNSEDEVNDYVESINKLENYGMFALPADDVGLWYLDRAFHCLKIRVHNDIKEFG